MLLESSNQEVWGMQHRQETGELCTKFWAENWRKELGVYGKKVLKWVFEKWGDMLYEGYVMSWVAVWISAFQEQLLFIEVDVFRKLFQNWQALKISIFDWNCKPNLTLHND